MRIVLVSDDVDFFEYITSKLLLRKSDELYRFNFDNLIDKIHLLLNSVLVINGENSNDKTLELLELTKGTPTIVFTYNEDKEFKVKVHKFGAYAYITMFMSDEELQATMIPALNMASTLEISSRYRTMLVQNNLLTANNEVYLSYKAVLDKELEKLRNNSATAVLGAISPNNQTKFLLQANQIETQILNHIRKNDILMNYAPNKYFLLLFNTDISSAQNIWDKIRCHIPEKMYAGFAHITPSKKREQLVNEALNKLHEAINYDKEKAEEKKISKAYTGNFKLYRKEFRKNFQNTMTPVLYQIQQKYNNKLFGMKINQVSEEDMGVLRIEGKHAIGTFKITLAGFSKINIDVVFENEKCSDAKRISLEPEEFESGLLEDLLEQFILEFKKEIENEHA